MFQQRTCFDYTITALAPEVAAEVRELILHLPKEHPYDLLKEGLLKHRECSDTTVGAILQQCIDFAWSPLTYFSRKLTPAETMANRCLSQPNIQAMRDRGPSCTWLHNMLKNDRENRRQMVCFL